MINQIIKDVNTFSDAMDKYTAYKRPTPKIALRFAIGEMGEAIQSSAYEMGKFLSSRVQEQVNQEICDALHMAVLAVDFDMGVFEHINNVTINERFPIVDMGCELYEVMLHGRTRPLDMFIKKAVLYLGDDAVGLMRGRLEYRSRKVCDKHFPSVWWGSTESNIVVCSDHLMAKSLCSDSCEMDRLLCQDIYNKIRSEALPWLHK